MEPGANWTPATSFAVEGAEYEEAEDDAVDPYDYTEIDTCLGPDDPGVGPWTDEFAD